MAKGRRKSWEDNKSDGRDENEEHAKVGVCANRFRHLFHFVCHFHVVREVYVMVFCCVICNVTCSFICKFIR